MYKEIQTSRLFEQIVAQIERRILNNDLEPGDKLPPENELARQFGVSRTAVREAMKALEMKGLVEVFPGKGTYIADSTSEAMRNSFNLLFRIGNINAIQDLVEVREILEPEIAALAAERATDDHIAAMREAYFAMENALDDPELFVEADLDFHLALAQATLNLLIPMLIDSLVDLLREHRQHAACVEGGMKRGQISHKAILEMVIDHNSDGARQAMRIHLKQIRQEIGSYLSSEEPKMPVFG